MEYTGSSCKQMSFKIVVKLVFVIFVLKTLPKIICNTVTEVTNSSMLFEKCTKQVDLQLTEFCLMSKWIEAGCVAQGYSNPRNMTTEALENYAASELE